MMAAPAPEVAMVLAAGRGERMRPLSDVVPKPALPLPTGPVLAWALRQAIAAGVGRVVVNAWHLPRQLRAALARVDVGPVELCISDEPELMGGAGGLALARDRGLLKDHGPVLVLNADCVFDLDFRRLIATHSDGRCQVTLAVRPHPDPQRWSRVVVGRDGLVSAIAPPSAAPIVAGEYLFTGAMVVSRAILDALPVRVGGIWENLWRPALEAHGLAAVVADGSWREVGTPAAYLECVLELLGGGTSIDASAEVAPGAVLEEALIGRGATIDASAEVRRAVVAEEARVGRGARVEDSVLLGAVRVGCGEMVIGEFRARAATELERGRNGPAPS